MKVLSDNLSGVFPPTPGGSHIVLRKVFEPVIVGTASYYTYAVRRRGENGKEEGRGRWEEKRKEGGREGGRIWQPNLTGKYSTWTRYQCIRAKQ